MLFALADHLRFAATTFNSHRLRAGLTVLGIAVGVTAVILLTSIGAGIHEFVLAEFTQFGTNNIQVHPGKSATRGAGPGIFGSTRALTIDDAEALRRVRHVEVTVPAVQGNAQVAYGGRVRRTTVYGVGPDFPRAFRMQVKVGQFLPQDDPRAARPFAVLGHKLRTELYGDENPLGSLLRIGHSRYRVIGVMEKKGQVLGIDLDDSVYLPAGRTLELFNREGLMEINVIYDPTANVAEVVSHIRETLKARHGSEDFNVTPQQEMLDVMGGVLSALTFAVGALGGISLLVGGVGILTIMTIAVSERTAEIGLLRALGARRGQVLRLFLTEAMLLAGIGGLLGLAAGAAIAQVLHWLVPALPVSTPWNFALFAELLSIGIGLVAGVLPARHAAMIDPVEALRTE